MTYRICRGQTMKNKITEMPSKGGIVIYRTKDNRIQLEVKLEQETVWLTQKRIARLFETQRPTITKHLHNIFKSGELKEGSVCSILEHTTLDCSVSCATIKSRIQYVQKLHILPQELGRQST